MDEFEVAIIGAGFAGLCAAVEMRKQKRDSFVVLERAAQVGGTWRDNTYPGVACDVPSHLYSYSFAPNPRWSAVYSDGKEILTYLNDVADRFDLRSNVRGGTNVLSASWDDDGWIIEVENGPADGCSSWWTDCGVNHALWPGSSLMYRMLLGDVWRHHFCLIGAA